MKINRTWVSIKWIVHHQKGIFVISNKPSVLTFLFVSVVSLGPHLAILRTYCWLCTLSSILRDHSWYAEGTTCGAGNKTQVGYMQDKHPSQYTISWFQSIIINNCYLTFYWTNKLKYEKKVKNDQYRGPKW